MKAVERYMLRLERRRYRLRAFRRRRELEPVADRTFLIRPADILAILVMRNEAPRLPFLLRYYRELGVNHFLVVDNASTDGTREMLAGQPDCSVWLTEGSYARARYGMDWANRLLARHGHGHWCLTVDADEFLVYPFCDTRPLGALCDWLDGVGMRTFGTMVLDMYPQGPVSETPYTPGENPFEAARWFDAGNYTISRNWKYGNLWIQGGPRARTFFADDPYRAPALNKIPLVKWNRRYAYVSSTHMLLPRGLNLVFDEWGGEKASGVLLHAKFLDTFTAKAVEETRRREHYESAREYAAYLGREEAGPTFWTDWSEAYVNWRQLEVLGLLSKGSWA